MKSVVFDPKRTLEVMRGAVATSLEVELYTSHDKLKCIGHSLASSFRVDRSVSHDKLKCIGHKTLPIFDCRLSIVAARGFQIGDLRSQRQVAPEARDVYSDGESIDIAPLRGAILRP